MIDPEMQKTVNAAAKSLDALVKMIPRQMEILKSNMGEKEAKMFADAMKEVDLAGKLKEMNSAQADYEKFMKKYK